MKFITRLFVILFSFSLFSLFNFAIAQEKKPQVDFVYFGTSSCVSCRGWRQADLPKLKKEPVFSQITFTEIQKPIPAGIPGEDAFPSRLAPYRNAIAAAFNNSTASPMFVILADGKVTWHMLGAPDNPVVIEALTKALATPGGQ